MQLNKYDLQQNIIKCFGEYTKSQKLKVQVQLISFYQRLIKGMQQETSKGISKSRLSLLLVLSIIILAAAVSTVVLLYIWEYTGFNGSSPVVLGTCTSSYAQNKYSNIALIIEIIFIACALAAFFSSFFFLVLLVWTIKKCKNEDHQVFEAISQSTKNFAYVLISLVLLFQIIPVGYYVSFIIELDGCSANKNSSQLLILLIITSSVFACSFLIWIILGCSLCGQNREKKYRQKQQQSMHSKESQKLQNSNKQNKPYKRHNPALIKREETKENIFQSPNRKHPQTQNPKKNNPDYIQDFQPQNQIEIQNLMNQSLPLKTKFESPILHLHPSLRPPRRRFEPRDQDYNQNIKQPLYNGTQPQDEDRIRSYNMRQDEKSLRREQKKFLSRPQGGILSQSGMQRTNDRNQRESRQRNTNQQMKRSRYGHDRHSNSRGYSDDRQNDRDRQEYRNRDQKYDKYESNYRNNQNRRSPPKQYYPDERFAKGKEDYKSFRDRYGRDDYMGAINPSYQQAPRRRQRDIAAGFSRGR